MRILLLLVVASILIWPTSATFAQERNAEQPAESGAPSHAAIRNAHLAAVEHYNRGVDLHQHGFFKQATDQYLTALQNDPQLEQAWSNLGAIYTAERKFEDALDAFKHALAIRPDRPVTLNAYATVLYAEGKTEEAINTWQKIIEIDPTFRAAPFNIGFALDQSGHHDEAQAVRKKAELLGNPVGDYLDQDGKPLLLKDLRSGSSK